MLQLYFTNNIGSKNKASKRRKGLSTEINKALFLIALEEIYRMEASYEYYC
jgi:hypothetical protein